jgi:hypothetical protein
MDSKKVLYFLGLLNRETSGHADEIAEIYKRALDENDDVARLKMLLNDYTYYREIGNGLYKNGEEMLDKIYAMPSKALDILSQLKQAHESIDNEVRICKELMHSPLPFSETITVLKKKDTIAYMRALKMIASTSVYLMILYAGLNPIKNLTWDDTAGIQEMIYAVNTKFLPALCGVRRPNYSWIIRRKMLGGRALFGGDSYYLNYENARSVEVLCSALHKEPIGTHAFLNIDAYESGEYNVPFCWGIGNIVSVSPDTAISFLQNSVATKLRSPKSSELRRKMPTLLECVKQLSDGAMFCITPDELLLTMNQWQVGHEIEERKRTHNCLFCGKHVDGNKLVCSSHFTTE